jgi:Do/DeqQ family serine protease
LPEQFRQFFGEPFGNDPNEGPMPDQQMMGSGSGVLISADGYIVTNNHVVADADALTVTLNDHRSYEATVIGADPSTDIALIKIEEKGLPSVQFANSDNLKVGEWVVAVGNPFNLESTVTAGIVSAKGRNININQDKTPIESFIQTDAAINPGNSGGALVNLNGDLVGVNTAIASPTGAYAGYGFAVPSNIVMKIVADLKEFGVVQRGFIGAIIRNMDGKFAKEKGLSNTNGVYVDSLAAHSAAAEAGVKVGDVITGVDGVETFSSPKLLEMIGRHRPGDQVTLTILRNGQEKNLPVILKNREGTTDPVKRTAPSALLQQLGVTLEPLKKEEAKEMGLESGVKITELSAGLLANQTEIQEGFVITKINGRSVSKVDEVTRLLQDQKGGIMIEGKYPGRDKTFYYAFGLEN